MDTGAVSSRDAHLFVRPPQWNVSSITAGTGLTGSLRRASPSAGPASPQVTEGLRVKEPHTALGAFLAFFTESCPAGRGKSCWGSGHAIPKYSTLAYYLPSVEGIL